MNNRFIWGFLSLFFFSLSTSYGMGPSPAVAIGAVRSGDLVQITQTLNGIKRYLVCMDLIPGDDGNNNGFLMFLTAEEIFALAEKQGMTLSPNESIIKRAPVPNPDYNGKPNRAIKVPSNFGYESTWWMISKPKSDYVRDPLQDGTPIKSGDTVIIQSLVGIGTEANCYLNLSGSSMPSWYTNGVADNAFMLSFCDDFGSTLSNTDALQGAQTVGFSLIGTNSKNRLSIDGNTYCTALNEAATVIGPRSVFKIDHHFSMFLLTHNLAIAAGKVQRDEASGDTPLAHPNQLYTSIVKGSDGTDHTLLDNVTIGAGSVLRQILLGQSFVTRSEVGTFLNHTDDYANSKALFLIDRYKESTYVNKDKDFSRFISIKSGSNWVQYNPSNAAIQFGGTRADLWERFLVIPSPIFPEQGYFSLRSAQAVGSGKPANVVYDTTQALYSCANTPGTIFHWEFKEIMSQNPATASARLVTPRFGDAIQLSMENMSMSSLADRYQDSTGVSYKKVGFITPDSVLAQWWLLVPKDDTRWGNDIQPSDNVQLYNLYSREYCFIDSTGSQLISNKSPQKDRSTWRVSVKKDTSGRSSGLLSIKNQGLPDKSYIALNIVDTVPSAVFSSTESFFTISSLRPYESFVSYGSVIALEYAERPGWTVATDQKMAQANAQEMTAFCTTNSQEKDANKWYIRYAQGESLTARNKWPVMLGDDVRFEFAGTRTDATPSSDSLFLFSKYGVPSSVTASQQRILTLKGDGLGCNWLVTSPTGKQNKALVGLSSMVNDELSNTSPLTTKLWLIHQSTAQGLHAHHDDNHKFNNDSTKREITGYMTKQRDLGTWQMKSN